MHNRCSSLVVREDQAIRQHHILPPTSRKDHDFSNVRWSQRLDALVDFLRLFLIAAESHNAKFGLDLTRVDFNHPYPGGYQLFAHGICEAAHGSFGGAVDGAALVWLAAGDGTDVDDVARWCGARLEDGKDGLCHVDKAGYVCAEHCVDVCGGDVRGLGDAFYEATKRRFVSDVER